MTTFGRLAGLHSCNLSAVQDRKTGRGTIVCFCAFAFFTCAHILRAGSKVKDTLGHSKYHLMEVGTLCFQFNGLISQGPEVRGHKSGSWQMSVSFKFPHRDLMLTGGKNLDFSLPFSLHFTLWKFAHIVQRRFLDQKRKEKKKQKTSQRLCFHK